MIEIKNILKVYIWYNCFCRNSVTAVGRQSSSLDTQSTSCSNWLTMSNDGATVKIIIVPGADALQSDYWWKWEWCSAVVNGASAKLAGWRCTGALRCTRCIYVYVILILIHTLAVDGSPLTLYPPRLFTTQVKVASRPCATVKFSRGTRKSGSNPDTVTNKYLLIIWCLTIFK